MAFRNIWCADYESCSRDWFDNLRNPVGSSKKRSRTSEAPLCNCGSQTHVKFTHCLSASISNASAGQLYLPSARHNENFVNSLSISNKSYPSLCSTILYCIIPTYRPGFPYRTTPSFIVSQVIHTRSQLSRLDIIAHTVRPCRYGHPLPRTTKSELQVIRVK